MEEMDVVLVLPDHEGQLGRAAQPMADGAAVIASARFAA